MSGLLPELSSLLLQLSQRRHGLLQILDVAGGLNLLQAEILRCACTEGGPVVLRPDPSRRRRCCVLECGVRRGVAVELDDDAFVQPSQLARHLREVEALLPSVQTVSRSISALKVIALRHLGSGFRDEPLLIVDQQRWNVIMQLGARKGRARRQRRVRCDGSAPRLKDGAASSRQVRGQGSEFDIVQRHGRALVPHRKLDRLDSR